MLLVHGDFTAEAGNRGAGRGPQLPGNACMKCPKKIFSFHGKREKCFNGLVLMILKLNQIPTRQDSKTKTKKTLQFGKNMSTESQQIAAVPLASRDCSIVLVIKL